MLLFARISAVAALVLGTVIVSLAPASAAGVTATFSKQAWSTGYTATVTIKNETSAAISSWKVEFDYPASTTVGAYWDSLLTKSGNRNTFVNREYNGSVAPGASVSFGFNAAGTADPSNCTVNGAACTGGTGPTTSSTTSTTTTTTTSPTTPRSTTPIRRCMASR